MAGSSLWRDRDFALLWGGQTVSEFGSMVTAIALPLVAVVILRATPFEVGLSGGLLVPLTGTGARLAGYVGGSLLLGASITVFTVCVRSAVQISTPPQLLGRTNASIRLFSRGALPLGALAAGALASVVTARMTLAVLMGLLVLTPLLLRLSPLARVRRTEQLVPAPD